MSFRRIPFQFTATDPAERQSELMRRFGLPIDDSMLVDTPNSPVVDAFTNSSPRLQHRLPQMFADGKEPPTKENCCTDNVHAGKTQPRVRVIPIQIESDVGQNRSTRQRTQSGRSHINSPKHDVQRSSSGPSPRLQRHSQEKAPSAFHRESDDYMAATSTNVPCGQSRVYNIPFVVEGKDNEVNQRRRRPNNVNIPVTEESMATSGSFQKCNGPCVSKVANGAEVGESEIDVHLQKPDLDLPLKQISAVLKELELHKKAVEEFSGSQGNKQYRYLDEMLTRCMLKLDDVETYGNEEVRKSRKAAVREIEKCISMLESKIQAAEKKKVAEESTHFDEIKTNNAEGEAMFVDARQSQKDSVAAKKQKKMNVDADNRVVVREEDGDSEAMNVELDTDTTKSQVKEELCSDEVHEGLEYKPIANMELDSGDNRCSAEEQPAGLHDSSMEVELQDSVKSDSKKSSENTEKCATSASSEGAAEQSVDCDMENESKLVTEQGIVKIS